MMAIDSTRIASPGEAREEDHPPSSGSQNNDVLRACRGEHDGGGHARERRRLPGPERSEVRRGLAGRSGPPPPEGKERDPKRRVPTRWRERKAPSRLTC